MSQEQFFFRNKLYPFDLELFNNHSRRSLTKDENNLYYLLEEYDYFQDLTEDSISTFINYCQNKKFKINDFNVIAVNFLANKYQVNQLIITTDKYIKANYKSIIQKYILSKINKDQPEAEIEEPKKNVRQKNNKPKHKRNKKEKNKKKGHNIQERDDQEDNKSVDSDNDDFKKEEEEGDDKGEKSDKNIQRKSDNDDDDDDDDDENKSNDVDKFDNDSDKENDGDDDDDDERAEDEPVKKVTKRRKLIRRNPSNKKIFMTSRSRIPKKENEIDVKEVNIGKDVSINLHEIYEDIISDHLFGLILDQENDYLLSISIPSFYRILDKHARKQLQKSRINKPNDEEEQKIITFLFKFIDKYGIEASILLTILDFDKQGIEFFNKKLAENCNKVDFNAISSKLIQNMSFLQKKQREKENEMMSLFNKLEESQKNHFQEEDERFTREREEIDTKLKNDLYRMSEKINKIEKVYSAEIQKLNATIKLQKQQITDQLLIIYLNHETIQIPKSQLKITEAQFLDSNITNITIPPTFTAIENFAFAGCKYLKEITIPKSITKIGDNAFDGCTSLTQLIIPSSVTEIGKLAFNKCSSIVQLTIDSEITKFQMNSFSGCSSLSQLILSSASSELSNKDYNYFLKQIGRITHLTIESPVTQIPNDAFDNCITLVQVILPSTVTQIGQNAFSECSNLKEITIPDSITKIEESAFSGCSSLMKIDIPLNITNIGSNAFSSCSNLTEIIIPSNVEQIGSNSFMNCTSLKKVELFSSSITEISENLFAECTSLASISIPKSVTQIGDSSFRKCSSLIEITIPSSVTRIGKNSFSNCSKLKKVDIQSELTEINESTFDNCSSLEEVILPSSITKIERNAFSNCSKLKEITFPSSLEQICESSFSGCSSLNKLIIPPTVNNIERNAFSNCSELDELILSTSIKQICENTFSGCSSLKKMTIPSSVLQIGNKAFDGCSSLTEIEIPLSVKSIGDYAFNQCVGLKKMTIDSRTTSIKENSFHGCISLNHLVNSQIILSQIGNITKITLPPSLSRISENAFKGFSSLTEVSIPSSVEIIEDYAFDGCTGLVQLNIDLNETKIEEHSFNNCSSLNHLILSSASSSLTDNNFCDLFKLIGNITEVTISSTVTTISSEVFHSCSSLTKIEIPESVTFIDELAFNGCTSLTQITIPSSVTHLSKYEFDSDSLIDEKLPLIMEIFKKSIFNNCTSLKTINFMEFDIQFNNYIDLENYQMESQFETYESIKVYKVRDKVTGQFFAIKAISSSIIDDMVDFLDFLYSSPKIDGILQVRGYHLPLTERDFSFLNLSKKGNEIFLNNYVILIDFMRYGCIDDKMDLYNQYKGVGTDINPTIRSKIIFGVASIMKKIHENDINRIELTNNNIFLDDNYEPVIKILSISQYLAEKNDAVALFSNSAYLAPEIHLNDGSDFYKPSDVYSFSIFLYRMFSKNIFLSKSASNLKQFIQGICNDDRPVRPKNIPDNYWELINRCWLSNPSDRPTFAEIVEILKNDEFALKEYEIDTDLNQLHEYQRKMEPD